jgi:hypothetical protein
VKRLDTLLAGILCALNQKDTVKFDPGEKDPLMYFVAVIPAVFAKFTAYDPLLFVELATYVTDPVTVGVMPADPESVVLFSNFNHVIGAPALDIANDPP